MNKKHFNIAMFAFGTWVAVVYAYIIWYTSWHEIPEANKEAFTDIRVTCRDLVSIICLYLFSSTIDSRRKSETIATLAKNEKA